uniref:Vacuolar protein-sorting-associated protein 36 n=1 Tax=Rhabditophanes sp. KR3021 TaxID=114890 RepID=A0AC35TIA4_9BILA
MHIFKGGKIIVHLDKLGNRQGQTNGPVSHSSYNLLRLVFKNGGEEEFYKKYTEALSRKTWARASSSSSSAGSRSSSTTTNIGPRGIIGIEKKMTEEHNRTHEKISQAFEDMSKLMDQAGNMVKMSKSITDKLRAKKGSELSDDETVQFKSYLLSLGVADPVTKSTFGNGSNYFAGLAQEISDSLYQPVKDAGGMMTLPDVYCRINRARGTELISPEDLLNACMKLDELKCKIRLHKFDTDVYVLQLEEMSMNNGVGETCEFVERMGPVTASKLAKEIGISVILAKEKLLAAEEESRICRDDSVEGLAFYTNNPATSVSTFSSDAASVEVITPIPDMTPIRQISKRKGSHELKLVKHTELHRDYFLPKESVIIKCRKLRSTPGRVKNSK